MKQYKDTPYFVDTNGNVYRNGKKMKTSMNKFGYEKVKLSVNGKSIHTRIHRIVAETYILNPENKPQVNHIDGNKMNNCVNNLEWNTSKENTQHAINNNLMAKGEKSYRSILSQKEVKEIRDKYTPYKYPFSKLAKEYGVSPTCIKHIIYNKSWKHI